MVRWEIFGAKIRFSICWYTQMNTNTTTACHNPQLPHANSTGNAPPIYVPNMGMNCETIPQNSANGIQ